jgi:flavodoxin
MKRRIMMTLGIFCSLGLLTSCSTTGKKPDAISSATLSETVTGMSELKPASKIAIVLYSSAKNNTAKIAYEFADVLDAQILPCEAVTPEVLSKYEVVGFGSGIFDQRHHERILKIAERLTEAKGKKVFIFSTSGVSRDACIKNSIKDPHDTLRNVLLEKGCEVVGEFNCPGLNKNSFLFLFGGMNKGRPNTDDLESARKFAQNIALRVK